MEKERCDWCNPGEEMTVYHDTEWGVPVNDDRLYFEHLTLDIFQAGLSWKTILLRRESFRKAFDNFDPEKISRYDEEKLAELLEDAAIIRNRKKIEATIHNASVFLGIIKEYGSFNNYLGRFTGGKMIVNKWKTMGAIPASTPLSDTISKEMKKDGFKFLGTTIVYAFMQATGIVNDHIVSCFRHKECRVHNYE